MCYKNEIQDRYADKLEALFSEDNTPEFIRDYFIRLGSEGTKRNNYIKIKSMITWMIGNGYISKKNIADVTSEDIDNITTTQVIKYLDDLKNNGLKNSTVSLYKDVLSGFWTYLVSDRYISTNAVKKVPASKFKTKNKPVKVPTGYSLEKFILNVSNIKNEFERIRNLAIIKLFIGSGIRKSELVGLDIDDLYLDDEEPYIMILAKGDQEEEFKEKVLINNGAVDAIREYLEARDIYFSNSKTQAVFLARSGERLTTMGVTKMFDTFSKGEIHPHLLRHYAGTMLYELSGHDLQAVKTQLNQKDVNTTSTHYVATNNKNIRNALNQI